MFVVKGVSGGVSGVGVSDWCKSGVLQGCVCVCATCVFFILLQFTPCNSGGVLNVSCSLSEPRVLLWGCCGLSLWARPPSVTPLRRWYMVQYLQGTMMMSW
jgi:hypothetical protein